MKNLINQTNDKPLYWLNPEKKERPKTTPPAPPRAPDRTPIEIPPSEIKEVPIREPKRPEKKHPRL